jgi:Tfp pilus assembly protein PilO
LELFVIFVFVKQVTSSHEEAEILRRENETLKTSAADKEERAKAVLKSARQRILQLQAAKNALERQLKETEQAKGTCSFTACLHIRLSVATPIIAI